MKLCESELWGNDSQGWVLVMFDGLLQCEDSPLLH